MSVRDILPGVRACIQIEWGELVNDKQIRTFLAVCIHESVTVAAQNLYISQQALSSMIGALESDLGVSLFRRSRRGMALTEAGECFYELMAPVMQEYDDALLAFSQRYSSMRGDLQLALAPGMLRSIGPDLLLRFQDAYPDIRVHGVESYDTECPRMVLNGSVDMALAPETFEAADAHYVNLKTEPLLAIMRRSHPLAGRESVTLWDLREQQFVSLDEKHCIYQCTMSACKRYGFEPDIRQFSKDVGFLLSLAREKDCIFICVGHTLKELAHDYVTLPIDDPEMVWRIGAVFKNSGKPAPIVNCFFKFVKNSVDAT